MFEGIPNFKEKTLQEKIKDISSRYAKMALLMSSFLVSGVSTFAQEQPTERESKKEEISTLQYEAAEKQAKIIEFIALNGDDGKLEYTRDNVQMVNVPTKVYTFGGAIQVQVGYEKGSPVWVMYETTNGQQASIDLGVDGTIDRIAITEERGKPIRFDVVASTDKLRDFLSQRDDPTDVTQFNHNDGSVDMLRFESSKEAKATGSSAEALMLEGQKILNAQIDVISKHYLSH